MRFLRREGRRHRPGADRPDISLPGISEFRLIFKGPAYMILGPQFTLPGMSGAAMEAARVIEVTDEDRRRWRKRVGEWLVGTASQAGAVSDADAAVVREVCSNDLLEAEILPWLGSLPRMGASREPTPEAVLAAVREIIGLPRGWENIARHEWRRATGLSVVDAPRYQEASARAEAGIADARDRVTLEFQREVRQRLATKCGLAECPHC